MSAFSVVSIAVESTEVTQTNGSVSAVESTEVCTQTDGSVSVGGAYSTLLSTEDKQTRFNYLGWLQKQVNEAKIKEEKARDDNIKLRVEIERLKTHAINLSKENEALKKRMREGENGEDGESSSKSTRSNFFISFSSRSSE
jgi:hypothetical protein